MRHNYTEMITLTLVLEPKTQRGLHFKTQTCQ